jgi:hypothetical protein
LTLDELLDLIPDAPPQNISAADLRTIVTDLWTAAHTAEDHFAFEWVTSSTPALGKASLAGGWVMGATALLLSEQTADGEIVPFGMLSAATFPAPFIFSTQGQAAYVKGNITGVATDLGSYRSIPITVTQVVGSAPGANTPVLFLLSAMWQVFL